MYKLTNITKSYAGLEVLRDFNLEIPTEEITMLIGPSGCGKTTLLNILAGLVAPDRGEVTVERVSYIFQEPRLLPWLTVKENIGLLLRDEFDPEQVQERVSYYLSIIGIEAYANFYPSQLSGGLKQRVSLARAFAYPGPLLLMDEPFKSLDLKTRYRLMADFINLWRLQPRTVVAVTHDLHEAVSLGDRVLVLTEKPVRIQRELRIEIPREERDSADEIQRLEKELFQLLLADV